MTSKKDLMKDLKFCKELMDRLVDTADSLYDDEHPWCSNRTTIQSDIIRLRRELNNVNHKLEWQYYQDK
jgi:hypothetical protein